MNPQQSRAVVMNLVTDDYYGLWEIVWRLKELCPIDSETELRENAEKVVKQLVKDGQIAVFWRETATSEPIRIVEDAIEILSRSENWREPTLATDASIWIGEV